MKWKYKQCGLYVLSFVVFSIGLFISFSDKTHAYDPDTQTIRQCSNHPSPPANYPRIRAGTLDDFAGFSPSGYINNPDASYLFIANAADETSISTNNLYYTLDEGFYFREHPTNSGEIVLAFDIPDTQTGYFVKNKWSSYTVYYVDYISSNATGYFSDYYPSGGTYLDAEFAYYDLTNLSYDTDNPTWTSTSCLHLWQNIGSKLPPALHAKLPDELKTDNNEYFPEDCGILEFTCWLPNIFTGLTDALLTLGEGIIKAITWLFVPNTDGLHARLQDIVDTMSDRFGVLWLPNDLLIHYFTIFLSSDPLNWSSPNQYPCNATDNISNPFGTSFVSFFGHTTKLNDFIPYCKALGIGGNYGTVTTYINYLIVFFRLSLLMAVLRLFYKKIHEEIII